MSSHIYLGLPRGIFPLVSNLALLDSLVVSRQLSFYKAGLLAPSSTPNLVDQATPST